MIMMVIAALESDDDRFSVIWAMNDRMFMIRGQTDKDTAVRMARGVKYLD